MALDQALYEAYIAILKEELVPALGCTEPIALAYASAKAAQLLGGTPERIVARCSGNIIKTSRVSSYPEQTVCAASRPPCCSARSAATPTRSWRFCRA